MSAPTLLSHLVPAAADEHPEVEALTCGDDALSWARFDERTGRLAASLLDLGVRPGDRVGLYLHKSIESAVALHGVLRAGAAYVPIDPMAPLDTVATIIRDCGIRVLVSHELRRPGVERLAAEAAADAQPGLELDAVIGLDGQLEAESRWATVGWAEVEATDAAPPVPVSSDDLAYVMYTSGSTGRPKGIMHTHRSGLAYATMSAELFGLGPHDRMANFSPLHFDMSTFELLAGILAASTVVLIPEPHLRLPASLTGLLVDQRCTTLYTVPSLFQQLLARGGLDDADLSAVRWVLPAGEVFPPEPLGRLIELLPNARFCNVYGPAEVNQCTYYHFDTAPPADRTLPIGYPTAGVELAIIDEADQPTPAGQQGELLVKAPTMMAGYWSRPDLDAASLVDRPGPGGELERWYRTGDLVSQDNPDAPILYYGRRDNQVKIRGNRIELETVEAAVGSLPGVENAVVGVRIEAGGDSQLVVRWVAAARSAGEDPTTGPGWRQALAGLLPPYAVPTIYERADAFPLTPSGKVDRRKVRELIADRSLDDR